MKMIIIHVRCNHHHHDDHHHLYTMWSSSRWWSSSFVYDAIVILLLESPCSSVRPSVTKKYRIVYSQCIYDADIITNVRCGQDDDDDHHHDDYHHHLWTMRSSSQWRSSSSQWRCAEDIATEDLAIAKSSVAKYSGFVVIIIIMLTMMILLFFPNKLTPNWID